MAIFTPAFNSSMYILPVTRRAVLHYLQSSTLNTPFNEVVHGYKFDYCRFRRAKSVLGETQCTV